MKRPVVAWRTAWLVATSWAAVPWAAAADLKSFDFEADLGAWVVLGDGAQVRRVTDAVWVRSGKGALDYSYAVGPGRVHTLVLPLSTGTLGKARALSLSAKGAQLTSIVLSLEEQGGGRWTAPVTLPAGVWTDVTIDVDDFTLSTGPDDPPDPNGRLDMDRVKQLAVVDVSAMLASQSADSMRMFGIAPGTRHLALDNVAFIGSTKVATRAPAGSGSGQRLDHFDEAPLRGLALGIAQLTQDKTAPLTRAGATFTYKKAPGAVLSWIQPIDEGQMAGSREVRLELASKMDTELVLKLEQSNGDKFQATFKVEGDGRLREHVLPLKDFERSDDSRSRTKTPDLAKVNQLVLMDIGGWFASKGDNRLSLQQIVAMGGSATPPAKAVAKVGGAPDKADQPEVANADTPGWSRWSKRVQPIYSGPYSLIGDPSVFKDGPIYRMFYSCYEPRRKGPAICQSTSPDGLNWQDVPVKGPMPGLMISARPGKWDDAHETPFAMKFQGQYLLYFIGYRDKGGFAKSFPAFMGLATSTDGVTFERVSDEPVFKPTPRWYDNDAVFSPSIIELNGELVMIYTGHCWTDCPNGKGVFLLAATSKDGKTWVKKDKPIMGKLPTAKAKDGAAEAEVVKGPDGQFYLFMSLLYGDDEGHEIGVAKAASPYGPWEVNPEAIIKRSPGQFDDVGPIAPSVLIENGKVRMWFHGFSKRRTIQIGYAEAPWPLRLNK